MRSSVNVEEAIAVVEAQATKALNGTKARNYENILNELIANEMLGLY